jgi:hypothetical protein
MRPILLALFGAAFVAGLAEPWVEQFRGNAVALLFWCEVLVYSMLIFGWVYVDSTQRGYSRPRWLDLGVLALALIFVPVYLVKSRPRGQRARALGRFLLAAGGFVLSALVGGLISALVRGMIES